MYNKHAVWCQCALVFTFVLMTSSLLSIQNMTLNVDLYWSIVLMQFATLRFIQAEHAPFFGISTEKWFEYNPNSAVYMIILSWSIMRWNNTIALLHVPLMVGVMLFRKADVILLTAVVVRLCTSWDACLLVIIALLGTQKLRPNNRDKSIASWQQRRRFGIMTIEILLQSCALWILRCEHRFPHIFRWTPIFAALAGVAMAILWCHFNVLKTTVSRNAIIVENGHGMAASLKAAQACPVCSRNLTSLDMESSFSDSTGI